jgi:hypothetical protein
MSLSVEEGKIVVELARSTIEDHLMGVRSRQRTPAPGFLAGVRGVFVTLNIHGAGPDRLRGCIGFPYPVKRIGDAVREAAVAAATEDPRFPPVRPEELDSIVIEVSVLTPPTPLEAGRRSDVEKMVRIGTDGLIVSSSNASGLLLPQVATEFGLDAQGFLSEVCLKAGLPPDAWLDRETKLQVFQAEVFTETSPRGTVVRVGD